MAIGRGRDAWDHTAALIVFVTSRLTGEQLNPAMLNPYRRAEVRRTPEQIERANREGWRLLETGLTQLAKG